jgi:hypothetical protein
MSQKQSTIIIGGGLYQFKRESVCFEAGIPLTAVNTCANCLERIIF